MLDVAVRLLAAFAAHPVHGVNEMAQGLPRATLLPGIVDDAPPIVALCNDSDDEDVAGELSAPVVPAMMFWGDSSADIEMRGYKIAKEVTVAAAFVTEDGVDAVKSNRECGYLMRAMVLTLGRYNSQENSKGYRELNGIKIHQITTVTEERIPAAVGTRKMWGFLAIRAIVVETLQ